MNEYQSPSVARREEQWKQFHEAEHAEFQKQQDSFRLIGDDFETVCKERQAYLDSQNPHKRQGAV